MGKVLYNKYGSISGIEEALLVPHVVLFRKVNKIQADQIIDKLAGFAGKEIYLDRFVIGSNRHTDEYYELR